MKITKVDIYMLDATAQRASRRPICCRIWTDEGFYGDGEAGIAFDYAAPAGIGMLQDISRLIIGKDPMPHGRALGAHVQNQLLGPGRRPGCLCGDQRH